VGDILCPPKSLYKRLSDIAYIDEWGVERRYTGLYWDIVNAPIAHLTAGDLDSYPWPDPDSIPEDVFFAIRNRAKFLHEETDFVVCASHPVYGVFELGLWMCGFEEFMVRLYEDEPFVRRFFEIVLDYQLRVIRRYYEALGPLAEQRSHHADERHSSAERLQETAAVLAAEARFRWLRVFSDPELWVPALAIPAPGPGPWPGR